MKGKAEEREVGELALVGSLDRWIGEGRKKGRREGRRRGGRRKPRRDFNALTSLLVVKTVARPSVSPPNRPLTGANLPPSLSPSLPLPPSCFTYRTETSRNDVVSAPRPVCLPARPPVPCPPLGSLPSARLACVDTRHGRRRTD